MTFTLSDIATITGGKSAGNFVADRPISTYLFDSRSAAGNPADAIFLALRSESLDGHQYVADAYRRGVRNFLVDTVSTAELSRFDDAAFIIVASVRDAIEALARKARKQMGCVVAITGSQGKTVVKEMIMQTLHRLDADSGVSRSPRSWNSRLGVPMSLLEAPASPLYIAEAGIDRLGDMKYLAKILRPEIGIFTGLTEEHSAGFKSDSQKLSEKLKLFESVKTLIYNASDTAVDSAIKEAMPDSVKLIPVHGNDYDEIDRRLAMAFVARAYPGFYLKEIEEAGHTLHAVSNRIDVHEGVNDCVMLYDGFSHDMRSLRASLDMMRRRATATRTSTLIISDAGKNADALCRMARNYGISRIIHIGPTPISDPMVENVADVDRFLAEYDINRFSSEMILIAGDPAEDFLRIKTALESPRHDTIFEINLDALVHNFNYYRSLLRPGTGVVGMVKASAYGTGALEVAKTLQAQGAAYLAVAVVDEGVELRRGGVTMPIMVLNPVTTNYRALFRYGLEPSVFSLRELELLVNEARKNGVKSFNAHIKLDTGMHRVGFTEAEVGELIEALKRSPELHVASIFSHLATADCPDQGEYTDMQLDTFDRLSSRIMQSLPYPVKRHILNTAGIVTHAEHQYDMVRLGIGLYGVTPVGGAAEAANLRTVAALKSTIISIKHWPAGTTIGYGRRGVLTRPSVIATIPIGYADGLDRHLSRGAASVVVNGVLCPIVGNICMDQCMIDITDAPDATIGTPVEIFGENQPVEHLADILDTIPYELLTSVSPRVKRIYSTY